MRPNDYFSVVLTSTDSEFTSRFFSGVKHLLQTFNTNQKICPRSNHSSFVRGLNYFFFFSPLEEKKVIIPIESSRLDVVFPCRKTLQDVSHCHHLRMALQNLGVFLVHVILINSLPRVNLTSNNWNYWRKKMMRLALTRFYRSPSRKDSLTCVRRWSCVCPVICVFLMLTYRYFFRARIYTYINHLDLRLPLLVFLGGCGLLLVHSVGSQTSLYSSFTCHDHQM